jgi:DNA sulfur modification protein DndD
MILREITFHNFLVYHGTQKIELPAKGESALTVVVGPNNSGKTSFIRGLKFWLYGEKGVPKKTDLPLLLNNKAKSETPVGSSVQAWVEVKFERQTSEGSQTVNLRRSVEGSRRGPENWQVGEILLREYVSGRKLDSDPRESDRWQARLEGMMPRALFDAFYFKGEPLDGKLLGDVTGIREALGLFLHEDQWKEAENAAAHIRDEIDRRIISLTAKNRELNERVREKSRIQEQLDDQRQHLEEEKSKRDSLEAELEACTESLAKLGNLEAAKEAQLVLVKAKADEANATKALADADNSIVREISTSLGLPFLTGAIAPVKKILAGLEEDNILPADICSGFIDRVLERTTCICGHSHDDSTRKAWEAYRDKTLEADVNEGLRKLLDWVRPKGDSSIATRSERTRQQLAHLLDSRKSAARSQNEARARLDRCEMDLTLVPHEEIARIGQAIQKLRSDLKSCERRLQILNDEVTKRESLLRRINEDIADLQKKTGVRLDEFDRLQAARDRADALHKLLGVCRNRLGSYFHRVLQTAVARAYDSKATDGSRAHIDRRTLLPSIHVAGEKTTHLGGGQSQLLALAYVVALAKLRQNMHRQLETLGVRLGRIDDLSFFMDSPFGSMEEHYKRAAVELIPESARQMVVLLWKEDWIFARPVLEPKASAIHAVRFHTTPENLAKIDPKERDYPLPGGDQTLLVPLPDGEEHSRSELIPIKRP